MDLVWQSGLVRTLGFRGTLAYHSSKRAGKNIVLRPKGWKHHLLARPNTSDIDVFSEVFIHRCYSSLRPFVTSGLIIDCGANVGYSTAYLLANYPQCRATAVEPDSSNFELLLRNTASFGSRVKAVHAGVWSHATPLAIEQSGYRDGREWSRQVRVAEGEMRTVQGLDIPSLMALTGDDEVDLLKVDVEGAEVVIFGDHYQSWLPKVRVIAIELHDDSSFGHGSEVFKRAIDGQGFEVFRRGELTFCVRPRTKVSNLL